MPLIMLAQKLDREITYNGQRHTENVWFNYNLKKKCRDKENQFFYASVIYNFPEEWNKSKVQITPTTN